MHKHIELLLYVVIGFLVVGTASILYFDTNTISPATISSIEVPITGAVTGFEDVTGKASAGGSCVGSDDCPSGYECKNQICQAVPSGSQCIANSECAPNQMCKSNSCVTVLCDSEQYNKNLGIYVGEICSDPSNSYACISSLCQRTKECQISDDCGGQNAPLVSVEAKPALAPFCNQIHDRCVADLSCVQDSDCGNSDGPGNPHICYQYSTGGKCVAWEKALCVNNQDCQTKFGSDTVCALSTPYEIYSGNTFCRKKVGYGESCSGSPDMCKEGVCDPVKKICAKSTANLFGIPSCSDDSECLTPLSCRPWITGLNSYKVCKETRCAATSECTTKFSSDYACFIASGSSSGTCKIKVGLGGACTANDQCTEGGCNPTTNTCSLTPGAVCTNGATCDNGQKCIDGTNGEGLCPTTVGQWCGQSGLTCKANPAPSGTGFRLQFQVSNNAICGSDNICGGDGASCSSFSSGQCASPRTCNFGKCGTITAVTGPSCPTENACTTEGAQECSGTGTRTCTANTEGCLVWSSISACTSGQTCTNGQCTTPLKTIGASCASASECQSNTCVNNKCVAAPTCTTNTDCAGGKTCQLGQCVTPPPASQNGWPSNTCRGQGGIACGDGETCDGVYADNLDVFNCCKPRGTVAPSCTSSDFIASLGKAVEINRGQCMDPDQDGQGTRTVTISDIDSLETLSAEDLITECATVQCTCTDLACDVACTTLPAGGETRTTVPYYTLGGALITLSLLFGAYFFRKKRKL